VTKWDGAENTDIEAVKGGLSGAMKRAAVQWGIGRYLYDLDEGWANIHDRGRHSAKDKNNKWFKWDPPELPPWALPNPTPSKVANRLRELAAQTEDKGLIASVERKIQDGLTIEDAMEVRDSLTKYAELTGAAT
jgi:hypothetical protein